MPFLQDPHKDVKHSACAAGSGMKRIEALLTSRSTFEAALLDGNRARDDLGGASCGSGCYCTGTEVIQRGGT
jgi:hypothetical protein